MDYASHMEEDDVAQVKVARKKLYRLRFSAKRMVADVAANQKVALELRETGTCTAHDTVARVVNTKGA